MSLYTDKCRHCRKPIAFATYRQTGSYEPDYDPFADPQCWRHKGGYAACFIGKSTFADPQPQRPDYVYVASSWRNTVQPEVCAALAAAGIEHYDFKNPPNGAGFGWPEVKTAEKISVGAHTIGAKGSDWEQVDEYLRMIEHPRAIEGFTVDFDAMERADTFVLVLPCGKSAHLELGWAVGAGKRTIILLEDPVEPELMYKMVDHFATSLPDLLGLLGIEQS